MTARPVIRVMKARRESTCPVCRGPIRVGQQIAKRGTWQHIEHVIEGQAKQRAAKQTASNPTGATS